MAGDEMDSPSVPRHVEATIHAMAQMHLEHHRAATPIERVIGRITRLLAKPWFLGCLSTAIAGWVGANVLAAAFGYHPIDPPPFPWLEGAVSLVSLYMVVFILASQRREDLLTERREQLTLELAILIEQETTKVIRLLEEIRQDSPHIHNRIDPEAEALSQTVDPRSLLNAIDETHAAVKDQAGH